MRNLGFIINLPDCAASTQAGRLRQIMVVYPNTKRISLVSFRLLFALFVVVLPTLAAHADSAKTYYSRGEAAEEKEDVIAAYHAYKAAFDMDPREIRYRVSYERLRTSATAEYLKEGEKFAQSDNLVGALAAFLKALDIDPGNDIAATGMRKLQKQLHQEDPSKEKLVTPTQQMAPPPALSALSEERFSLHMSEDCRNVYEAIGKAVGLNVLFDPDYTDRSQGCHTTRSTADCWRRFEHLLEAGHAQHNFHCAGQPCEAD